MEGYFTISGSLPGLNEIIQANRSNRYAGAKQKKEEMQRCKWEILSARIGAFRTPIRVSINWIERDLRRDPDNICAGTKFFLDALVELGKIPNDSRRYISEILHKFSEPDRKNPRIEVTLTEL